MNNTKHFLLLIGLIFFNLSASAQWNQIGLDIDGELLGNYSGRAVSMSSDGLTVAIGAYGNDETGSNAGHVRIYKMIAGTWVQLGLDINGEVFGDYSGWSVSLSGDGLTLAIGAIYNDGNGANSGNVRVYKLMLGVWLQQGTSINGEAPGDNSGWSTSISNDGLTVAIGAPFNNENGSYSGHARVYKMIAGVWTQLGADIDGQAADDRSGYSVSLSGDGLTVAVGALYNDENGIDAGQVRVYMLTSGVWAQQGLKINGEATGDYFGCSVSMSSDGLTVAIGALGHDGIGPNYGHVRVYKLISGSWVQQGGDIDGEYYDDISGESVSISNDGETVAIGATGNNGNGPNSGHVRVYKLITGFWTQQGGDINGEAAGDWSGSSVSISADGLIVAIGAMLNDGYAAEAGHVRVYSLCPITQGVDVVTTCDSYLWIDNNTYTASNTVATHILTNSEGCDSVVTLNLTINSSTAGVDIETACDSYLWIDNNTYITNNTTATHVLTNSVGCDSVVTLNLTINSSTAGVDIETACDSYLWIDNNTYIANNTTATHVLTNSVGCDSVVTLNLTINTVDVSTTLILDSITSNATSATYRWLDCSNNTVISGETDALFIASANGSYAVEVTQNGCIDTSSCINVTGVGISEDSFGSSFKVYPNPTSGNLSIYLGEVYNTISLKLLNIRGQLIDERLYQSTNLIDYKIDGSEGIYFMEITSKYNEKTTIKVIKE